MAVEQNENGVRHWTVNGLKEYIDAKFQTIIAAAKEAKDVADRLTTKTDEANKVFATKEALDNLQQKIDALVEHDKNYLSKSDYETRHNVIQEKIDKLNETPWGTITSLGMVLLVIVGGFWGLAYGPIQSRFDQLEKRDRDLADSVTLVMSRQRENDQQTAVNSTRISEMMQDHQRQIRHLQEELRLFATKDEINNYRRYIEDHNNLQDRRLDERMTKDEFNAWEKERGKLIASIEARIERLANLMTQILQQHRQQPQ